MTRVTAGSTPVREKVAGGGNAEQNASKKKKSKKKPTAVGKEGKGKVNPSPPHAGVEKDGDIDLEAAHGTRPPSTSKSAEEQAIDEFEVGIPTISTEGLKLAQWHVFSGLRLYINSWA